MTTSTSYRARLRFRLRNRLNIPASEYRIIIAGQEVVLTQQAPDQNISDSEWLTMNARGFATEDDARQFGRKLSTALQISSISARLGIDVGRDLPTSSMAQGIKEQIATETKLKIRNNVHGLDVFPDDPNVRIVNVTAVGSVLSSPDPFLSDLEPLHRSAVAPSRSVEDVILLLNYALMRSDPVSQIVFSVSAVESLGQDQTWTTGQKQLLRQLSRIAEESTLATAAERLEVAEAISKSLHRLTLRQGVFRLLNRVGLAHLKKPWDALYAERSTLVHGLAPQLGSEYSELAQRTISLCGHILLTVIATELPDATRHLSTFYPI